jgi:hypothetical protein
LPFAALIEKPINYQMKNTFKILLLAIVVATITSCQGKGMGSGVTDSVANHPDSGASTTVDTLPKTVDSTSTDTVKQ